MARIEDFILYLQAEKRYASHTLKAYKNDLEQFHAFCQQHDHGGMDLHFKTIRSWVVSLMDSGYAPRSVHRKLTSLQSYCRYLLRTGELDSNPMDKVLKPRLNKRVPSFIEEAQMELLLNDFEFGDDFEGIRNILMLDLLYQTGIRRSELIGLSFNNLDLDGKSLKVMGKRSKERIIPLGDAIIGRIREYIPVRNKIISPETEGALFITLKGKPVYDKLVYRIVNQYLSMVTTLEDKSPHVLRHTFATHMLNHGADLNTIKELLGHANLSATQVYTHNTFKKLKSIYNQAHPRA
jgi:integrase/recombinase XerC